MEAREASVCSYHAAAARSIRAAAQARPAVRVLGGRPRRRRRGRSPRRPRIRKGSLAVDGHARMGILRTDRHHGFRGPRRAGRRRQHRARLPRVCALCPAARRAARPAFPHRPRQRRRGVAHVDGCRTRSGGRGAVTQPDRSGGQRVGAARCARTRGLRPDRAGRRSAGSTGCGSRPDVGGRSARRLRFRPVHGRRRTSCRTSDSWWSRPIRTSRGCGWNSTRASAGRPRSKRRWNGCWRAASCSSPSGRGSELRSRHR